MPVVNVKGRVNKKEFSREIFVQEYSVKTPSSNKPSGKTLFCINVPPYIHESQLKFAYGDIGAVKEVIVAENDSERNDTNRLYEQSTTSQFNKIKPIDRFKVAYVVFESAKSLRLALQKTVIKLNDSNNINLKTGTEKWFDEFQKNFVDESALESEVAEYMKMFETKEQEAREDAKKTEIDEDGWVTVKRSKAGGGGFEQKESVLKALEEKIARGKKRKEFKNFYTFQIRQSKYKHIVSLRKRFQDDKLKIEALKKSRRFKPF